MTYWEVRGFRLRYTVPTETTRWVRLLKRTLGSLRTRRQEPIRLSQRLCLKRLTRVWKRGGKEIRRGKGNFNLFELLLKVKETEIFYPVMGYVESTEFLGDRVPSGVVVLGTLYSVLLWSLREVRRRKDVKHQTPYLHRTKKVRRYYFYGVRHTEYLLPLNEERQDLLLFRFQFRGRLSHRPFPGEGTVTR